MILTLVRGDSTKVNAPGRLAIFLRSQPPLTAECHELVQQCPNKFTAKVKKCLAG
jgi:hypothetical protein